MSESNRAASSSELTAADGLYLRMPRCGSTSIRTFCAEHSISYTSGRIVGYWGNKTGSELFETKTKFAELVREQYEDRDQSRYTFSCVRNPYSRAVSVMHHASWLKYVDEDFTVFCRRLEAGDYPSLKARWHAISPYFHLFDSSGNQLVSYIWQMESLTDGLETVAKELGISDFTTHHKRNSRDVDPNRKHYTDFYTPETKDIISRVYERDIDHFGYEYGE